MTSIVSCMIQWTTRNLKSYCSFGLFLKSCFLSVIVCGCEGVWVWVWVGCGLGVGVVGCVCECVCVDGFNMDVLVRVHGCVSLHFSSIFLFLFFSRSVLVIFRHFCMIRMFLFFLRYFSRIFLSFSIFVIFIFVIFFFCVFYLSHFFTI